MDASSIDLVGLMTNASQRFIIPVYQRAYSWDEEQCVQLWDDILAVGRRGDAKHFTGSVVWVQQGVMSASGITPVLLIDGQQRITTVTLLIIALAEYARDHPDADLVFSCEEIIDSGYLVKKHKRGEDHYKLMLSQGDRGVLCSIIDHLEDPDSPLDVPETSRLVQNLDLFRKRLAAIADPNIVWMGIQRLQIVSISLDQGRDNPQLIFESMNSTGKALSTADLIRNYVLMSQTAEDQERLYRNHWRKIEETLGADSYDEVFDDFIRNWLTVLYAPEPLAKRDVYALFKRHVADNGYDRDGRIVELLRELERFAGYYARITAGTETDPDLKLRLDRLARLGFSVAHPLLLSFFNDYDQQAFSREDFISMLDTLESYLLRRAVCDCGTNSLDKFFSSIIARLNKVQDEGGDYYEAFEAYLLNEVGTARRFPTNVEFMDSLRTRDLYGFRKSLYVLSRLENSYHPKDERDFATGCYTIEHIMPRNAMAHEEWRAMLGEDCEEKHGRLVNTLGNLTLTAYNSELSDSTFVEKKARAVGGYDNEFISLSADLREADTWGEEQIRDRGDKLAQRAVEVWPAPELSEEQQARYAPKKKGTETARVVAFKDVFNAGLVKAGTKLVPATSNYQQTATVTADGALQLENGEVFASPSRAAGRCAALGGGSGNRNGWHFWLLPDGRILDELRREYLSSEYEGEIERVRVRLMYWDGFLGWCADMPEFAEAFGDMSGRRPSKTESMSFGKGIPGGNLSAIISPARAYIALNAYFWNLEAYAKLHGHLLELETLGRELGATEPLYVDDVEGASMMGLKMPDHSKRSRVIRITRAADFDAEDWDELYAWHAKGLLRLRAIVLEALA